MRASWRILSALLLAGLLMAAATSLVLAQAPEPEPHPIEGTSCESLSYEFGVRVNVADFRGDAAAADADPALLLLGFDFQNADGELFGFAAEFPVNAVIVKGGPDAVLVYDYGQPGVMQGQGLHAAPDANQHWQPLEWIDFCFGQQDDNTGPLVSKTAETSFTRTWAWTIDKSARFGHGDDDCDEDGDAEAAHDRGCDRDHDAAVASGGFDRGEVTYKVRLDATATDTQRIVNGTVTVVNRDTANPLVVSVTDVMSGTEVPLTCNIQPANGTYTLGFTEADNTLSCTYSQPIPDGVEAPTQNEVTVTYGDQTATARADIHFDTPTTEQDECVQVWDKLGDDPERELTQAPDLLCVGDGEMEAAGADGGRWRGRPGHPGRPGEPDPEPADDPHAFSYTFEYEEDFGDALQCGGEPISNVARFVAADSGAAGQDEHTLDLSPYCTCALSYGYWKNHAEGDRYDDTWDLITDGTTSGPGATFHLSGQTYLEVLHTPPAGGNVYYILAHQYIAARLNLLRTGVTLPDDPGNLLAEALSLAETFFAHYTPDQALSLSPDERRVTIWFAALLERVNNGAYMDFRHCDDLTDDDEDMDNERGAAQGTILSRILSPGGAVMLPLVLQE